MGTSLHLAFFVPSLAGGGAERVITTLANALVDRGHQVDLLLTSKHGPFTSDVNSRVTILDFECRRTWHTVPSLVRVLRQRRPDIIVTALLSATVAAYAAVWLLDRWDWQTPSLCATVHSLPTVQAATVQGIRPRLLLRVARFVFQDVDHVVAVSNTVAQDLSHFADLDASRIETIPNPFDVGAIQSTAKKPFRHEWLRDEPPVVVAAGRLNEEKAYPDLLRALSHLRSRRTVRALILGDGPERDALNALCHDLQVDSAVSFLGFVENPYPIMARADLLVLPSPTEAFGNVVVEALACGTPVVVRKDSGGPVEILDELNVNYHPLSAPSPASLAETIDDALNAPVNREALRKRAAAFNVSRITDQYVSLFQRVSRLG